MRCRLVAWAATLSARLDLAQADRAASDIAETELEQACPIIMVINPDQQDQTAQRRIGPFAKPAPERFTKDIALGKGRTGTGKVIGCGAFDDFPAQMPQIKRRWNGSCRQPAKQTQVRPLPARFGCNPTATLHDCGSGLSSAQSPLRKQGNPLLHGWQEAGWNWSGRYQVSQTRCRLRIDISPGNTVESVPGFTRNSPGMRLNHISSSIRSSRRARCPPRHE